MTRPEQSGEDPHQPGAGSAEPAGAAPDAQRPDQPPDPGETAHPEPGARPWDWAIDPAPPEGPDQEPVADPMAGRSVDAPDWSTPETPASTPPLSGDPHPLSWPAHTAEQGNPPDAPKPGPLDAVPELGRPGDRRWWFVLGIVAALLSCCCVAAGLIALAWPEFYSGLRGQEHRVVGHERAIR